jgi:hypothetical protein
MSDSGRLVLSFHKDANLADNWNPVVPPFVPLYEDADEGENRIVSPLHWRRRLVLIV